MNLEEEVKGYIDWINSEESENWNGEDEDDIPEDRHSDPMDVYHQFVDLEV